MDSTHDPRGQHDLHSHQHGRGRRGIPSQAIADAETNAGNTDTIRFAIGSGAQTITLVTPLPIITDPVIIDGTSQPGFASAPIIVLNGVNLGARS